MSRRVRPSEDISTLLPGGPTAWEAREALSSVPAVETSEGVAPSQLRILALGSRLPNGLTPLKWFCARPSQTLAKLLAAVVAEAGNKLVSNGQNVRRVTNLLPGAATPG